MLAFLVLALAASVHCMGMCGGFTAALAAQGNEGGRRWGRGARRVGWFALGKAGTYTILGLALSLVSTPLHGQVQDLGGVLAWIAGGALVLLGLVKLGLPWPKGPAQFLRRVGDPLRRAYGRVASLPGYAGPLGAGLVAGTLPCGVTWGALALALTFPPVEAAAGMFLFGLATVPALAVPALGWTRWHGHGWAARLVGPLLIVLGLWTGLRGGLPGGGPVGAGALPACCTDSRP